MQDSTLIKGCSRCGETKPLSDFNKQARSRDGHHYYCRPCQRSYMAENKARNAENARRWEAANPGGCSVERSAQWRAENAEQVREYRRGYRVANTDALREKDRAYYVQNMDEARRKGRERSSRWRQENPDKARAKDHRRRALKLSAYVEDVDLLALFERDGGICYVCKEAIDAELSHPHLMSLSLEHVIPLSLGGKHSYENCSVSHLSCNASKGVQIL